MTVITMETCGCHHLRRRFFFIQTSRFVLKKVLLNLFRASLAFFQRFCWINSCFFESRGVFVAVFTILNSFTTPFQKKLLARSNTFKVRKFALKDLAVLCCENSKTNSRNVEQLQFHARSIIVYNVVKHLSTQKFNVQHISRLRSYPQIKRVQRNCAHHRFTVENILQYQYIDQFKSSVRLKRLTMPWFKLCIWCKNRNVIWGTFLARKLLCSHCKSEPMASKE